MPAFIQLFPAPSPQIRSLNRSELSLSALFSILSPLKNFSLLSWASENVTASVLLLCYYTGSEIYSWKSLNPKGGIHLHESTQLERKTWLNLSSLVQKRTESCDSIVSVTVFKLHQFLNCHISLHFLSKGLIHEV